MHTKRLTRRDFLGLLDLLEGALGFNPGLFRALAILGEFGLSSRNIALQGLALPHRVLELLLDLVDPGLELFTGGLLLVSLPLGFCQGLSQGLDLGRGSCTYYDTAVNIQRLLLSNTQQVVTHLAPPGAES